MNQGFYVYCGLDVGKSEHHATALDRAGQRLFDKPLPQDEAKLRELFSKLRQHGKVLMIVDQPNTIGALPVAVARDCGCEVAYLPGLAMRKAGSVSGEVEDRCPGRVHHRRDGTVDAAHPARGGPGQRGPLRIEGALRL
jgi:hypothetical protein